MLRRSPAVLGFGKTIGESDLSSRNNIEEGRTMTLRGFREVFFDATRDSFNGKN
jgi:hypothetical protein